MKKSILFLMSLTLLFGCVKNLTLRIKADNGKVEVSATGKPITNLGKIKSGTIVALNAVANEGYQFSGWTGDLTGTENPINFTMNSDKSVEAKFIKKMIFWKIIFNANGGTGTMVDQIVAQGYSINLNANSFVKAGYSFAGWSTSATGSVEYPNNASYTMGTADSTLYAVWNNVFEINNENLMINVSIPVGGLNFPITREDNGVATVSKSYYIAQTEVTYNLWKTVHTWATGNGYSIASVGRMGSRENGAGMSGLHPVTKLCWRDAIVFCNAITEWYNATQTPATILKCVYYTDQNYTTPLRTSTTDTTVTETVKGSQDFPYIQATTIGNTDITNCTATGFRLPTHAEWECASRWQGTKAVNSNYVQPLPASCTAGYFWTKGNSASGATANYNDATETGKVAVYDGNSGGKTAPVKSKLPNALGLYDMCGNVLEWHYDWNPYIANYRIICGSSWFHSAGNLQVGYFIGYSPESVFNTFGLRLAKSHN